MTTPPFTIDPAPLDEVVGRELELGLLTTRLAEVVRAAAFPTVGMVHITCADEAQHRVVGKVQQLLVEPHVTPMASGERTAFRLQNLGGHHEFGALSIAEDHWAGAHDELAGPKLMVVRVDSHVGVDTAEDGHPVYGRFLRFGRASVACGALHAVLRGVAMRGAEGFMDHHTRARTLTDSFDETSRMLAAAVCRAELSAQDCLHEIAELDHDTPTVWLVVATVTMNHPDRHSSMLTGVAVRGEDTTHDHRLGVDVLRYRIGHEDDRAVVTAD